MIIRSSPTGGNFFAAIKSFDANITILDKFVLTVKKLDWWHNKLRVRWPYPEIDDANFKGTLWTEASLKNASAL